MLGDNTGSGAGMLPPLRLCVFEYGFQLDSFVCTYTVDLYVHPILTYTTFYLCQTLWNDTAA